LALEKRDIDRQACVVYVRRSFTKGRLKCTKTEASSRAVPLQAIAVEAIDRQSASPHNPLLFPAEPLRGRVGRSVDLHTAGSSPMRWVSLITTMNRCQSRFAADLDGLFTPLLVREAAYMNAIPQPHVREFPAFFQLGVLSWGGGERGAR
jgi:hypothetical protein